MHIPSWLDLAKLSWQNVNVPAGGRGQMRNLSTVLEPKAANLLTPHFSNLAATCSQSVLVCPAQNPLMSGNTTLQFAWSILHYHSRT